MLVVKILKKTHCHRIVSVECWFMEHFQIVRGLVSADSLGVIDDSLMAHFVQCGLHFADKVPHMNAWLDVGMVVPNLAVMEVFDQHVLWDTVPFTKD